MITNLTRKRESSSSIYRRLEEEKRRHLRLRTSRHSVWYELGLCFSFEIDSTIV